MSDPPVLPFAAGRLMPSSRQYRSTSQSPTRQRVVSDDLVSHLSPMTVVEAFRSPAGSLKSCLDTATATEQAFAMRAAVASEKIYMWLDELLEWSWPADGGSSGFEAPPPKRRRLSGSRSVFPEDVSNKSLPEEEEPYMGSLPAAEVARYERRVDQIQRDMDELDVEEIKRHVLHNHILPLSRPGTPMSDNRSVSSSVSTFNKMDDLTAIITTTVVQALPNLSRLTRLMNTWVVRLAVLRKVPTVLASLTDAEVAIQSGWNAIELNAAKSSGETAVDHHVSTLSRKDFDVMRLVLEKKVNKAARGLDYMLDCLEGRQDTLPEEWCDRMDAVERGYSEWVAVCERKLREAEWAKAVRERPLSQIVEPTPVPKPSDTPVSNGSTPAYRSENSQLDRRASDVLLQSTPNGESHDANQDNSIHTHETAEEARSAALEDDSSPPVINVHWAEEAEEHGQAMQSVHGTQHDPSHEDTNNATGAAEREGFGHEDGTRNYSQALSGLQKSPPQVEEPQKVRTETSSAPTPQFSVADPEPSVHVGDGLVQTIEDFYEGDATPQILDQGRQSPAEDDLDVDDLLSPKVFTSEEREPSLPPLLGVERPGSSMSTTSTVIHPTGNSMDYPSDRAEYAETPEGHRLRTPGHADMDGISPPSSPPGLSINTRAPSVSFDDKPAIAEIPNDGSPPKTPQDSSFLDDSDFPQDLGSPGRMSEVSTGDDHLQQQISEILESIPAKIHLSSQPNPVNLNPPDLQLPYTKTRPTDRPGRSHSSLSSRSGTPSFLLAPAYARNPRPRLQRGNQEIKLYHLSRSTGEAPIKLFIRCVGENGERVMVRVGGGWADLGEYLKDYASHHGRRSTGGDGKVEIRDLPRPAVAHSSSPPSRPASALDSPITPLNVRKTRKSIGEETSGSRLPKTPLAASVLSSDTPSSEASTRSRSSSRLSWTEEDSTLGMAGPRSKNIEMSEESKAWVESVKEKVRIASGERKPPEPKVEGKFGEMGKVGTTKRLFRRGPG